MVTVTESHAALQADGSIVVGGLVNIVHYWWGYPEKQGNFAIGRITSAGREDKTFGQSGITVIDFGGDDHLSAVIIQDDQKILVIGQSTIPDVYGLNFFRMGRLNSDGTVDATFNFSLFSLDSGSFATTNATVDKSGKIIIEGNGVDSIYILRYNTDGTLDSSFNGTGGINLPYDNGSLIIRNGCAKRRQNYYQPGGA